MSASGTTRCCSAVALIASLTAASPRKIDRTPPSLFPTQPVWNLALNNQLAQGPTYDTVRAYFPIDGDRIVAYDILTGLQLWVVSANPQMEAVAGDDRLFFIEPGLLTALRASDGSIAWQLPFSETLAVRLVWDNGWLVAATSSGSILAFRASDGEMIWRRDLGSAANARPALAADRVYVPTDDGRIVALQVATGAPVWETRVGGKPNDILALVDRIYLGSLDNFFYCLMAKDGRIDWKVRTGGDVKGLPTYDEDHIYFVSLDNVLRSLDRVSGNQKWMKGLPFRPAWPPVRVGSTIAVAGQSPTLKGFKIADGTAAGDITAESEITAAPHVVTTSDGRLPTVLVVTRDIAKGAAAMLVKRSIEPAPTPAAPLPNPTLVALPPRK